MKNQSCTDWNVQIQRNSSEEMLIIKIEKIGSDVLLFLEHLVPQKIQFF